MPSARRRRFLEEAASHVLRNGYKSVLGCTWASPDRRPIESHASGPTTGTKIVTSAQTRACVDVRRLAVRAIETSATTTRAMTRSETMVQAMSYPVGIIGLMESPMASAYGEGSTNGNGTAATSYVLRGQPVNRRSIGPRSRAQSHGPRSDRASALGLSSNDERDDYGHDADTQESECGRHHRRIAGEHGARCRRIVVGARSPGLEQIQHRPKQSNDGCRNPDQ